jgi:hypothetical protein
MTKRGKKWTEAKAPPTSMALPGMTWTFNLPPELKIAIAEAVTVFSRIDHAIIECIWALEAADLKRKRQIAKEHAHENIQYVRRVVKEHLGLEVSETWDALAALRNERNLIAHGVWTMQFGGTLPEGTEASDPKVGRPMVLWHSKMLESGDFVTAESFDYWRFKRFMDHAQVLLKTFLDFKNMAEDAIEADKRTRAQGAKGG